MRTWVITGRSSGICAALDHAVRTGSYDFAAKYMVDAFFHLRAMKTRAI